MADYLHTIGVDPKQPHALHSQWGLFPAPGTDKVDSSCPLVMLDSSTVAWADLVESGQGVNRTARQLNEDVKAGYFADLDAGHRIVLQQFSSVAEQERRVSQRKRSLHY